MSAFSTDHLYQLIMGLQVSIALLGAVTVVGMAVGAAMAAGHLSRSAFWRGVATSVDIGLRGFPPVVLLFLIYYGFTDVISLASFWAATLALGLRAGGYFGRIFEGAVLTVPKSQTMAARSIGLGGFGAFVHVVLPQSFRHALPGIANEISSQLKLTSLAFVIGVVELMRQARYLITTGTGSLLGLLMITALLYYLANAVIFLGIGWLERRNSIPGLGAVRVEVRR
jgi:polar amino acid transport system permease protein